MQVAFLVLLLPVALAQLAGNSITSGVLPCGFSCSGRTFVTTLVDGVFSRAECSDRSGNVMNRCGPCCAMKALSAGLSATQASGLPSVNGDCVCCFLNNRC